MNEMASELLERIKHIKSKRALLVANHILEHGHITTDDIRNYGYSDPYRPTMDLKDEGIPLETFRLKNEQGRSIAAYRLGDPAQLRLDRKGGRKAFSKEFKRALVEAYGSKCVICLDLIESRYLQIDHRTPYGVAGDNQIEVRLLEDFMLLCGSCNRAKSWSCEHCRNFAETKNPAICKTCYWARPDLYEHIALQHIRRLEVVWRADEIEIYERLRAKADKCGQTLAAYIKSLLVE